MHFNLPHNNIVSNSISSRSNELQKLLCRDEVINVISFFKISFYISNLWHNSYNDNKKYYFK